MFKIIKFVLFLCLIAVGAFIFGPRIKKQGINLQEVSQSLDSFISHSNSNSPVVLGLKISDTSLDTMLSVIKNLPPNEVAQIKNYICAPATPSSK